MAAQMGGVFCIFNGTRYENLHNYSFSLLMGLTLRYLFSSTVSLSLFTVRHSRFCGSSDLEHLIVGLFRRQAWFHLPFHMP